MFAIKAAPVRHVVEAVWGRIRLLFRRIHPVPVPKD
jgi:hypothetical protein